MLNAQGEPPTVIQQSSPLLLWIPAITCVTTAIGTFSAIALAWRADRRNAIEQALKIAQLERDLAEAKGGTGSPKPKKSNKKVR